MSQRSRAGIGSGWTLMQRLSKAFQDPLRLKVLAECRLRETSPREFQEAFSSFSPAEVSAAFDVLVEYGWLAQVQEEAERGTDPADHLYRATGGGLYDEALWPTVPADARPAISMTVFETLADRVREAVAAGTMDARDDRHLSWTPLALDRRGWETVISRVDALFYAVCQEQRDADARMAESGEKPIPMTVALLAFESPAPESYRRATR